MNTSSREEEIFETKDEEFGATSEDKLTSYKATVIDRPAGFRGEDVQESRLNPEAAYGVFNGKTFYNSGAEYYSIADAIERRAESPLQRLARLRGELDELKSDLDLMVEAETNNGKINSVWSVLQTEVSQMSAKSATLESHKGLQLLKSNISSHERSLSEIANGMKSLNMSKDESHGGDLTIRPMDGVELARLEGRVHKLETLLGNIANFTNTSNATAGGASTLLGGAKGCPYPLLDAVARLEERVALLDLSELDSLKVKCEAVRSELDGAIKSKSTLSAEAKVVEAVKQLSALIAMAERVDSVAGDLPALVLRLKTLEQVHQASSGFLGRLSQMEGDVRSLTGELSSNKDVLRELKESIAVNVATMQENISAVNGKISAIKQQ